MMLVFAFGFCLHFMELLLYTVRALAALRGFIIINLFFQDEQDLEFYKKKKTFFYSIFI